MGHLLLQRKGFPLARPSHVFGGDLSAIQLGKAEKNHQMLSLFASHWRCGKSTTCYGISMGNPMGFPLLRNADLMSKACPKPKDFLHEESSKPKLSLYFQITKPAYKVVPQFGIAKLVQITTITKVYGSYNYS